MIPVPGLGGLARATAGDAQAAMLLPTEPTRVFLSGPLRPNVNSKQRTPQELIEAAALWRGAELPGDPFARNQRDHVLESITRQLVSTMTGGHWASLERRLESADNLMDHLEDMRRTVGSERHQKALAADIASHLSEWLQPGRMVAGFSTVITPTLARSGMASRAGGALFLLLLAGKPWRLAEWGQAEVADLLRGVQASPILLRTARFAVLGTQALEEAKGL